MISRLTAFVTVFASTLAVAAAAALTISAQAHSPVAPKAVPAAAATTKAVRFVELPHVVVVARRGARTGP